MDNGPYELFWRSAESSVLLLHSGACMSVDKLVAYLVTTIEASKNVMIFNLPFLFFFPQSLMFLCNCLCVLCLEFKQIFWQWMLAARFQMVFRHWCQEMLQDHQLVGFFCLRGRWRYCDWIRVFVFNLSTAIIVAAIIVVWKNTKKRKSLISHCPFSHVGAMRETVGERSLSCQ